jgi:hypothetical protein
VDKNIDNPGINAGGLVGKVTGGKITNSFATGSVTGKMHVGGVVGSAQDGLINDGEVSTCYATGAVTSEGLGTSAVGHSAGGIAGYIQSSSISECVALNSSVSGVYHQTYGVTVGRITGNVLAGGTLSKNLAYNTILDIDGNSVWNNGGHNDRDGFGIPLGLVKSQSAYTTMSYSATPFVLGWDFSGASPIWKMGLGSYQLPVLSWQTSAPTMPSHLE